MLENSSNDVVLLCQVIFNFFLKQVIFKIPVFRFTGDVHFHSVFGTTAAQRHDHCGMCVTASGFQFSFCVCFPLLNTSHNGCFQIMWVRKTLDVMADLKTLQEKRRERKRKEE